LTAAGAAAVDHDLCVLCRAPVLKWLHPFTSGYRACTVIEDCVSRTFAPKPPERARAGTGDLGYGAPPVPAAPTTTPESTEETLLWPRT
jgi:hypothetical protein